MTMLTYWNWLVAAWIFLIISISTIISFQCGKKGKSPTAPATTPGNAPANSAASAAAKPAGAAGGAAAPNPPAEAAAAEGDGHYEDVTVG